MGMARAVDNAANLHWPCANMPPGSIRLTTLTETSQLIGSEHLIGLRPYGDVLSNVSDALAG